MLELVEQTWHAQRCVHGLPPPNCVIGSFLISLVLGNNPSKLLVLHGSNNVIILYAMSVEF
jgi:hypothetical protein